MASLMVAGGGVGGMITYLGLAHSLLIWLDGLGWVDGWDDRRFQWPHLWWLGQGGWIVVCGLLALGFMLLLWSLWLLLLLSVLLLVVVAVAAVAAAAAFGGASGNGGSASSASAAAFGGSSGRAAGNGVSASGVGAIEWYGCQCLSACRCWD